MDAVKSVENEVDKVSRLFSDCRNSCAIRIDQSAELLEKLKRDLVANMSCEYRRVNLLFCLFKEIKL